jgi:hypothetical protein
MVKLLCVLQLRMAIEKSLSTSLPAVEEAFEDGSIETKLL